MEITPLTIYLITRLDVINGFCVVAFIVSLFTIAFVLTENYIETGNIFIHKCKKMLLTICCISALLLAVLPTKQDAIAMYLIPKIANNVQLKDINTSMLNLMKNYLESEKSKNSRN